jgi:uncharacterized protein (DUF924 family)
MTISPENVLAFWFSELTDKDRFSGAVEIDRVIIERFGELHRRAVQCELFTWRDTADGRLAEIIVLDQFSRQIHRGQGAAFASDALALALAQEMVRSGDDLLIEAERRSFVYMPYMHSE